jgi:hypothetical protein
MSLSSESCKRPRSATKATLPANKAIKRKIPMEDEKLIKSLKETLEETPSYVLVAPDSIPPIAQLEKEIHRIAKSMGFSATLWNSRPLQCGVQFQCIFGYNLDPLPESNIKPLTMDEKLCAHFNVNPEALGRFVTVNGETHIFKGIALESIFPDPEFVTKPASK